MVRNENLPQGFLLLLQGPGDLGWHFTTEAMEVRRFPFLEVVLIILYPWQGQRAAAAHTDGLDQPFRGCRPPKSALEVPDIEVVG